MCMLQTYSLAATRPAQTKDFAFYVTFYILDVLCVFYTTELEKQQNSLIFLSFRRYSSE